MKQFWSKSLACLLCLALLVGMLPVAALAEDNPPAPANDGISLLADSISYIDADGSTKNCDSATVVTENDTAWGKNDNGEHWYVVTADTPITISTRVTVSGNVHLILADGCKLTASQGINVSVGNSLTIYAQSAGENMGALTADGRGASSYNNQAGIGGGNFGCAGGNSELASA